MDFLETFFVSLNLSIFGGVLWLSIASEETNLKQRLSVFLIYFCFFLFLTTILTIQDDFHTFYLLKKFFFSEKILLIFILCFLLLFIFPKKKDFIWILVLPSITWFLFFLFFGRENFRILNIKVSSLNLFQAHNPILFCSFFPLMFLSKRIWIITLFILTIGIQFIYCLYDRKNLETKLPSFFIYYKYSSPEFFLSNSFILVEGERGIYEFIRKENISEPIYKFTMKPLRYHTIYERQYAQWLVQEFEFPIVLRENDIIVVYELFKSYRGNSFRVEINRFSLKGKIKGAKF